MTNMKVAALEAALERGYFRKSVDPAKCPHLLGSVRLAMEVAIAINASVDGLSLVQVSAQCGIEIQTATQYARWLAKVGLVDRVNCPVADSKGGRPELIYFPKTKPTACKDHHVEAKSKNKKREKLV